MLYVAWKRGLPRKFTCFVQLQSVLLISCVFWISFCCGSGFFLAHEDYGAKFDELFISRRRGLSEFLYIFFIEIDELLPHLRCICLFIS